MFCTSCGANNPDGMNFCTSCGAKIGGATVKTPTGMNSNRAQAGKTSKGKIILPIIAVAVALFVVLVATVGVIGSVYVFKNGNPFAKTSTVDTESESEEDTSEPTQVATGSQSTETESEVETEAVTETEEQNVSIPQSKELTEAEKKLKEAIENLNGDNYTAPVINVSDDTGREGSKNKGAEWDRTVFYTLEGKISSSGYYDKNVCTLRKMSLVNAETGHTIDYDVYVNPSTNVPNKIVAIEYLDSGLDVSEYYFDNNKKVSFVFKYTTDNYVSGYAIPTKAGNRYLFKNDCMVTWRTVNENGTTNRVIGQNEADRVGAQFGKDTIKLYDSMSNENKTKYDNREKKILNEAYNTLNAVLNYSPTAQIQGYVHDSRNNVVQGAEVYLYTDDSQGILYSTETDSNGMYSINVPTDVYKYNIVVHISGYENSNIHNIEVNENTIVASQDVAYMFTGEEEDATVEVKVGDALNYSSDGVSMRPLSGASVYVREGLGNKNGDVIMSTTCDSSGLITLNLPAGSYTLEIQADSYETTYRNIVANPIDGVCVYEIYTSPTMESGQYRIVLTWGATPRDLDSHLFTIRDGSDTHVWYNHESDQFGNYLDVDDIDSYGPETITIYDFRSTDYYKYCVVDYTNNSSGNDRSTQMSYSNATVNVYSERGLVATFNVPTGREGVLWEVFEIRNGEICPIQRYYDTIEDTSWIAH